MCNMYRFIVIKEVQIRTHKMSQIAKRSFFSFKVIVGGGSVRNEPVYIAGGFHISPPSFLKMNYREAWHAAAHGVIVRTE